MQVNSYQSMINTDQMMIMYKVLPYSLTPRLILQIHHRVVLLIQDLIRVKKLFYPKMHRIIVSTTRAKAWTWVAVMEHVHGMLKALRIVNRGNSKDKITRYKEGALMLVTSRIIRMKIYLMYFIRKTKARIKCDRQLIKANLKLRKRI